MITCNSCTFVIGEKETRKKCEDCGKEVHAFCLIKKGEIKVCDVCYVRKAEEKRGYQFELPEYVRRTHIETYRKCPNKFRLEVLEGHEQPPRTYTQVGIDLHEIFEKAVGNRDYGIGLWRHDYYNHYLPLQREVNLYESDEEEEAFNKRAEACFKTFEEILPDIPKPFMTEVTIFFAVSPELPKVRFTMDLVTENEQGGLDLHDWKTGKELVGKQLAEDLQAPIYIYGVEQETGRRVDSFTFYYLKDNKVRKFVRVDDDTFVCQVGKREYFIKLSGMIAEIQGLFARIKNGKFSVPSDSKSMFFACKMCHLKEQGLCLGADQQGWHDLNGGKVFG